MWDFPGERGSCVSPLMEYCRFCLHFLWEDWDLILISPRFDFSGAARGTFITKCDLSFITDLLIGSDSCTKEVEFLPGMRKKKDRNF